MSQDSTDDAALDGQLGDAGPSSPEPGLVLIFAATRPALALLPLGGTSLELGRGQGDLAEYPDSVMSRRHALAAYREGLFELIDLTSRNGSAIDGVPFQDTVRAAAGALLRLGQSLFLCCQDLRPLRRFGVKVEAGRVEGPGLQMTLRTVAQIGEMSRSLCISGESGSGKESAARAFHRAGPHKSGPFVAVNCAAIPKGVAERLLFGARKGVFSGAISDSQGYIGAASGGTLFLDEIADLDPAVQSKLLRVIENGELLPLGATLPRKVEFRICAASHRDLRERVQSGKFRADLYFRIGVPQITVAPLRERKEEIPWHVAQAVQNVAADLVLDVSLVEAALLRVWPGNIRELTAEIRSAALTASASGSDRVTAAHLRPNAGTIIRGAAPPPASPKLPAAVPAGNPAARSAAAPPVAPEQVDAAEVSAPLPGKQALPARRPSKEQLLAALLEVECNIAAASRALELHPTQLRRFLAHYNIDLRTLRTISKG